MNEIDICFFCINPTKKVFICELCITEQQMSNYYFQLCHHCMEKHRDYHHINNKLGDNTIDDNVLDLNIHMSKKGNFTEF